MGACNNHAAAAGLPFAILMLKIAGRIRSEQTTNNGRLKIILDVDKAEDE